MNFPLIRKSLKAKIKRRLEQSLEMIPLDDGIMEVYLTPIRSEQYILKAFGHDRAVKYAIQGCHSFWNRRQKAFEDGIAECEAIKLDCIDEMVIRVDFINARQTASCTISLKMKSGETKEYDGKVSADPNYDMEAMAIQLAFQSSPELRTLMYAEREIGQPLEFTQSDWVPVYNARTMEEHAKTFDALHFVKYFEYKSESPNLYFYRKEKSTYDRMDSDSGNEKPDEPAEEVDIPDGNGSESTDERSGYTEGSHDVQESYDARIFDSGELPKSGIPLLTS